MFLQSPEHREGAEISETSTSRKRRRQGRFRRRRRRTAGDSCCRRFGCRRRRRRRSGRRPAGVRRPPGRLRRLHDWVRVRDVPGAPDGAAAPPRRLPPRLPQRRSTRQPRLPGLQGLPAAGAAVSLCQVLRGTREEDEEAQPH